jgi:hypothetical protein
VSPGPLPLVADGLLDLAEKPPLLGVLGGLPACGPGVLEVGFLEAQIQLIVLLEVATSRLGTHSHLQAELALPRRSRHLRNPSHRADLLEIYGDRG